MVPSLWDHCLLGIEGKINNVLSTLVRGRIIGGTETNKDSEKHVRAVYGKSYRRVGGWIYILLN